GRKVYWSSLVRTHSVVFLLQSSLDLPVVHSFPTRRSSDLIGGQSAGVAEFKPPIDSEEIAAAVCRRPLLEELAARLERFLQNRSDRKSTRLNSSHDQISYAVFCLKKKTPSHPRTPGRTPLA